jgi:hypothetical protein
VFHAVVTLTSTLGETCARRIEDVACCGKQTSVRLYAVVGNDDIFHTTEDTARHEQHRPGGGREENGQASITEPLNEFAIRSFHWPLP